MAISRFLIGGVASALLPPDTLATTHRGHGHVLARGLDLDGFFKEIMGRAGGLCQRAPPAKTRR